MDANVTDLLAYRMQQLVSKYGDSPGLAEAIAELLQCERNARAGGGADAAINGAESLFGHRRLRVVGSN